jgi:hypothetical protein
MTPGNSMSELWQRVIGYLECDSSYYISALKDELSWCTDEERQLLADMIDWYMENHNTVTNDHFGVILDCIKNFQ